MGADLYIESIYQAHDAKTRPAFDKAVTARDKHQKQHGCQLRYELVDAEELTSQCEVVTRLQARVSKAYTQWSSENPGYYRDSYNNSNLLWRLEGENPTSYWQGLKYDRKGNMSVTRAKTLLKQLKAAKIRPVGDGGGASPDGGWSSQLTPAQVEEWNTYFREKKVKFEAFLQRAIDLKEPIRCSC